MMPNPVDLDVTLSASGASVMKENISPAKAMAAMEQSFSNYTSTPLSAKRNDLKTAQEHLPNWAKNKVRIF